jgi:stage V sporulation protein S
MEILKVSSKSNPNLVAGAIVNILREDGKAELHSIGAGAINQCVKAIAIARGYLKPSDLDLICLPSFLEVKVENNTKTAIKMIVSLK